MMDGGSCRVLGEDESGFQRLLKALAGWLVVHIFIIMKWRHLTLEYTGVSWCLNTDV